MLSHLHMLPKDYIESLNPHRFIPAGPNDLRAPCPALNTLANHGYINRDGRGLTLYALVKAQVEVFNISYPLALSLAVEAVFLCGNGLTATLEQVRAHNRIEHDASLSREDVPGNSWQRDPELIKLLIADSGTIEGLSFKDMARVRVRREKTLKGRHLDFAHLRIALGEACLTIGVWGFGGGEDMTKRVVSKARLRSFFLDERLPEGWARPLHRLGFLQTLDMGGKLQAEMKHIQEEEEEKAAAQQTKQANKKAGLTQVDIAVEEVTTNGVVDTNGHVAA